MGHQIIKEPGKDTYAVFSSYSDTWILWNATAPELEDYYAEKAAKDARRHTAETIAAVEENQRRAYYQFTLTFEEANRSSVEGGGPDLTKLDVEEESPPADGVTDPRLPLAGSRDAEESARSRRSNGT